MVLNFRSKHRLFWHSNKTLYRRIDNFHVFKTTSHKNTFETGIEDAEKEEKFTFAKY